MTQGVAGMTRSRRLTRRGSPAGSDAATTVWWRLRAWRGFEPCRVAARAMALLAGVFLIAAQASPPAPPSACDDPDPASVRASGGLHAWIDSGGEARAGLAPGELAPLAQETRRATLEMQALCTGVQRITSQWASLARVPSAESGNERVDAIVIDLRALEDHAAAELQAAASARSRGIEALGMLDRAMTANSRQADAAATEIDAARERERAAVSAVEAAQRELDGSKGFWNGVLTGLTLGTYNPLKSNLDRARANAELANQEHARIVQRQVAIAAFQQQLAEGKRLVTLIDTLDETLTGFQNTLTAALAALGQAREDYRRGAAAQAAGSARFYLERGGREMAALGAWIERFRFALGRVASAPMRMPGAIALAGAFPFHPTFNQGD